MQHRLGDSYRYYRICYNLFSAITLFIPILYGVTLQSEPLIILDGILAPIRFIVLLLSIVFFIAGAQKYDMSIFTGIFQASTGKTQEAINIDNTLDLSGIHQVTRHPWYIGGIMLLWSYKTGFDLQSIITNTILSLYFIIGAFLEEKKLVTIFGHNYKQYQREVSMLLPWRWLKKHLSIRKS